MIGQKPQIAAFLLAGCLLLPGLAGAAGTQAAGHGAVQTLAPPTEASSLETANMGVSGLGVFGSRLVVLLGRNPGIILNLAFQAGQKTRQQAFGPLSGQQRLTVAKDPAPWDLVGADLTAGRLLLFEAMTSNLIEADPSTGQELLRRSVPWDLIKPPADRGGEATRPETAALRQAFKRAWLATSGLRIVGLARMPAAWHAGSKVHYLLATRIKGFPLLQMSCSSDEPSSCMIERQCYLEGAGDLQADDITGLGVVASSRLVLIGDRRQKRLAGFRFSSCYHVPRVSTYALPAQLKTLTNITVDSEQRLWLTTAQPDDYLNASVYVWSKGTW